eukprot:g12436.t1
MAPQHFPLIITQATLVPPCPVANTKALGVCLNMLIPVASASARSRRRVQCSGDTEGVQCCETERSTALSLVRIAHKQEDGLSRYFHSVICICIYICWCLSVLDANASYRLEKQLTFGEDYDITRQTRYCTRKALYYTRQARYCTMISRDKPGTAREKPCTTRDKPGTAL